jgi:MFS family permease
MAETPSVSFRAYSRLVRGNRNFRLLWSAQIVSEIGDWLYSVALYSLLLEHTGSARAVALAFVLQVLPHFFVAPAAGVINDHASRKRVMMLTDWARALIVLLMLVGQLPSFVWLLYLLLTLETVCWALFEPARTAAIPNITSGASDQLAANTLSSMTWSFTLAVGSALGGLLAVAFGRSATFTLNSLSFVLSGWLISRMRFTEPHLAETDPLEPRHLVDFSPILEGIRYVRQDGRRLATMLVKTGLALMGTNWVLLPVLGERVFPLPGASGGMYSMSVLMGCRGVGALLGPAIAARITGSSEPRLRLGILVGFSIGALGYLWLSTAPNLLIACLAVVFAHSGGSIAWVFSTNLLQTMTGDRFRGRVFSAEYAFNTLLLSAVTWSVGISIDHGARPRALALVTGLMLVVPAVLWTVALRRWRSYAETSTSPTN